MLKIEIFFLLYRENYRAYMMKGSQDFLFLLFLHKSMEALLIGIHNLLFLDAHQMGNYSIKK